MLQVNQNAVTVHFFIYSKRQILKNNEISVFEARGNILSGLNYNVSFTEIFQFRHSCIYDQSESIKYLQESLTNKNIMACPDSP